MKILKRSLQTLSLLLFFLSLTASAQTPVSGGIYTYTTWSQANSPYIVTDTVILYPGATLSIMPGVEVRFENNTRIEVRKAQIFAEGTPTDSITFTSNSGSPAPSSYQGIFLNGGNLPTSFRFCNFYYADIGIYQEADSGVFTVRSSKFTYNRVGVDGLILSNNYMDIDSCVFMHNTAIGADRIRGFISNSTAMYNQAGLGSLSEISNCNISYNTGTGAAAPLVNNCFISHNHIGVDQSQIINNCSINYNDIGVYGTGNVNNCKVNHNYTYGIQFMSGSGGNNKKIYRCSVDSNDYVGIQLAGGDTVLSSNIRSNAIGILDGVSVAAHHNTISFNVIKQDSIGIKLYDDAPDIYCNKICSNTAWDLQNCISFSNNCSIANNYWCASDSAAVASRIYDGYDNASLGLVFFMPIDTIGCYMTVGMPSNKHEVPSIRVYPNPAVDHLNLQLADGSLSADISIFNMLGELQSSSAIAEKYSEIDISRLPQGIYIIEVITGGNISRSRFIKQ